MSNLSESEFSNKTVLNNILQSYRLILVILIFLIGTVGVIIYYKLNPSPYVSTQDNFKIVFPGSPSVYKLASKSDSSGGTESGRLYALLIQSSDTDYAVYVINYSNDKTSPQTTHQKQTLLQADINQMASQDNATVTNGKFINFDSNTAVQATLVPTTSTDASAYLTAFLNTNHLYMIIGSGLNFSKYQHFINTFRLIN